MAKKALCDALSIDQPNINALQTYLSPTHQKQKHQIIPTTSSSSVYASSAENISRLLKNWVHKSPNSAPPKPESHDSIFDFESTTTEASESTTLFQEDLKSINFQEQLPLSMLESWLLAESNSDPVDLLNWFTSSISWFCNLIIPYKLYSQSSILHISCFGSCCTLTSSILFKNKCILQTDSI